MATEKGKKYRAEVFSKADGFLLDSKLTITDAKSGKQIASNDDVSRGKYDARVEFSTKEASDVEIRLSDAVEGFGPRHAYELIVQQIVPGFSLSVAADHFVIASGKTLEIPVTVSRDRGFSGKIKVAAVGLPKGVSAEPVVSENKGASAKSVKLKLTVAKDITYQGSLRIVGTLLDKDDKTTDTTNEATFPLRSMIELKQFWLTVSK